uniref:Uncharacterized protein n=1 Tax=Caenorhabditis japonica TaxID=281687 RepID=A0A8R1HUT2_CAEJA
MLISGALIRGFISALYLLILSTSTVLTYVFFSEPVLFAFVLTAVSLLVLSYPVLCLFKLTHLYDLEVVKCCQIEWIPVAIDLEAPKCCTADEKPSKLDLAFVHAYM